MSLLLIDMLTLGNTLGKLLGVVMETKLNRELETILGRSLEIALGNTLEESILVRHLELQLAYLIDDKLELLLGVVLGKTF